ncbi:MAG: hypothetical protein IKI46_00640 [Lachnospiraceae bacterium]|nr:hypothetical protein [Lachnospiraceae bacterium]
MNLRKTKVSIATNAIYVLVASLFSILAIMDAAKQLGYSYLPGLITFGVFAVIGLVLWKVFSLFSNSDQVKAIFEKGDTLGLLVFAVLIIASIIFRVASYAWNGLGGTIYFEQAKVTGSQLTHYVHACDDWYIAGLHAIFFLFGNRIFIAAIFNCILQLAAVVLGFFAFRKMLGIIPALFFTGFWSITGFSVHEALTLNSRNLVFLLMMLALFAISKCVPATGGKFICYLVSGILTAICIYADIIGIALIPFIIGIVFNDLSDEETDIGLRLRKMLFTLISVVFGLVLIIFLDSYLSSSNPSDVMNSVLSLYGPSKGFTFGFTYLTSYIEVTVIAVIVSLGLFVCFLAEKDSKSILLLSIAIVALINNFGLTYLENDGREIFFAFAALFAGSAFRELFPDEVQGNIFKASSDLYDNEFTAPDKGYVPAGVKNSADLSDDDFGDIGDGMTDTSAVPASAQKSEETPAAAEVDKVQNTEVNKAEEKKDDVFEYPAFDSAPIAKAHTADAAGVANTSNAANAASAANTANASGVPRVHLSEAALAAKAARDAEKASENNRGENNAAGKKDESSEVNQEETPADRRIIPGSAIMPGTYSSVKQQNTSENKEEEKTEEKTVEKQDQSSSEKEENKPERPKTYSTYTYQKPQLRPEFRRRPGAWAQSYLDKDKDKIGSALASGNGDKNEEKVRDEEKKAPETKAQESKAPAKEEKKPEIAPNGAVLLDNPIPHPARKTEHKNMEYDVNVDDSSLHYDINISDNDDFDV